MIVVLMQVPDGVAYFRFDSSIVIETCDSHHVFRKQAGDAEILAIFPISVVVLNNMPEKSYSIPIRFKQ